MPKQIDYSLSEVELKIIRRSMASDERPEVRQRATAVHMLHQGMEPQAVADAMAITLGSVYKWHARWREGGLEGLAEQPKSGAPRKADEAYWQRVEEIIMTLPSVLGHSFTVWTSNRIVEQIFLETGIRLSPSRFCAVMQERGHIHRLPKRGNESQVDVVVRECIEEYRSRAIRSGSNIRLASSLWRK